MGKITEMVEAYKSLLDQKDEIEAKMKELNASIETAKAELVDAMLEEEVTSVTVDGYSYTVTPKTRYSKKAGSDDELFEMLRDHGLGDLIKETVNAMTLQGAMSEEAKNNDGELPPEWDTVINTYSFNDITKRKKTK